MKAAIKARQDREGKPRKNGINTRDAVLANQELWNSNEGAKMDIIDLARASGMQVILDGRIGSEIYQSVCGSVSALERFAAAVRRASESARNPRAKRAPRKPRGKTSAASQGASVSSDFLSIRIIR